MVVIVPHPTQQLQIIRAQKKLISLFNTDEATWYSQVPLVAELPLEDSATPATKQQLRETALLISAVKTGPLTLSTDGTTIYLPLTVDTKKGALKTELPLLHKLTKNESKPAMSKASAIELPPSLPQCQLFLAFHDAGTTVQGCKTSSYIFQDSVWFKQSK